jgi:hypothetical protein
MNKPTISHFKQLLVLTEILGIARIQKSQEPVQEGCVRGGGLYKPSQAPPCLMLEEAVVETQ